MCAAGDDGDLAKWRGLLSERKPVHDRAGDERCE
jgi:hypothetical protein